MVFYTILRVHKIKDKKENNNKNPVVFSWFVYKYAHRSACFIQAVVTETPSK